MPLRDSLDLDRIRTAGRKWNRMGKFQTPIDLPHIEMSAEVGRAVPAR